MKVEVGVVTGPPLIIACKQFISVIRTWRYAKKRGIPFAKWYGVYELGTEHVIAHTGCLPGAEERAEKIAVLINSQSEE